MSVVLVFDTETTTTNKGNVYDPRNKLCSLVVKVISNNSENTLTFTSPWDVGHIKELFASANLIVGFNLKFDLGWIRREFDIIPECRLWDCQYGEFLFSNQTWKFPDLQTSCAKRGLGEKLDLVKVEYWDKGIDTDQIPLNILLEYNVQDVEITYQLYLEQVKLFAEEHSGKYRLFRLHMLDLPVLLEMEWNGLLYNKQKSIEKSEELTTQVDNIERTLNELAGMAINWGSGDERSSFLYGGRIERKHHLPIGVYQSGEKKGQPRYKVERVVSDLPRRVEPAKGTEYKKGGVWSTDEDTLRSLKVSNGLRKIIDMVLERAKLEKLNGTYLKGLPKKMEEMNWGEYLHPSYNQCATVTGRVASSNPNGQNIPPIGKQLIESRF